jgi:hypothetical protein
MIYKFTFTEEQANQVVAALAKQPFEAVYNLVAYIQSSAKEQLDEANRAHTIASAAKEAPYNVEPANGD